MQIFKFSCAGDEYHENHESTQQSNEKSPTTAVTITTSGIRKSNLSNGLEKSSTSHKGITGIEFVLQAFITNEGPPIFVLPAFFKNVGYLPGILGSFGVAAFYAYMVRIFLWCDDQIRTKKNVEKQSLYSLITNTFDEYKCAKIGLWLNVYLKYEIILSWAMGLSFNLLYATKNVQLILHHFDTHVTDQFVLGCLSIPTMLVFFFPHIKSLTIFSYFITLTMLVVLVEILYYLLIIDQANNPRVDMINDISTLPDFLLSVFNFLNFTAILFPLKIEMKNPNNSNKLYGGCNVSIFLMSILNTLFSVVAYFQLGDRVKENIIDNLPSNHVLIITNGLFIAGVVGSGALSFFVIFQTLWIDGLENFFKQSKYITLYEYAARFMLGLFIIITAISIPTYGLFINMISCFSYPYDSVLLPIILESVIVWNECRQTDVKTVLILGKNLIIGIITAAACSLAFYKSTTEMLSYYNIT